MRIDSEFRVASIRRASLGEKMVSTLKGQNKNLLTLCFHGILPISYREVLKPLLRDCGVA